MPTEIRWRPFSLRFRALLPPLFLSPVVSTPVTYVARKIAAERFTRFAFFTLHSLVASATLLNSLPEYVQRLRGEETPR